MQRDDFHLYYKLFGLVSIEYATKSQYKYIRNAYEYQQSLQHTTQYSQIETKKNKRKNQKQRTQIQLQSCRNRNNRLLDLRTILRMTTKLFLYFTYQMN